MKIDRFKKNKMKFFLCNENALNSQLGMDDECYWFYTNIKSDDDFADFVDTDTSYELFMDKMETSSESWAGVHDTAGGEKEWGYNSYEIEDFKTAIIMWFCFFMNKNLTLEKRIYISTYRQMENGEFDDEIDQAEIDEFVEIETAKKYNL